MDEKIKALVEINTDDARFLLNIIKAYISYNEDFKNKRSNTKIILKEESTNLEKGIINLDEIDADRYFYTKMRLRINYMIELLLRTDNANLSNKKILHNIIYSKNIIATQTIGQNKTNIVDLIRILDKNHITNMQIVAKNITDINLFMEEQINIALEIIKINNKKYKIEKIYDYIYSYLEKDYVANNYCDFIKDKCISQRRLHMYPITRKDGCCFMQIRKCIHLHYGQCDTQCMACRLFSCPYLTKRGIEYYANEFILLDAFLSKKQRKELVFDFYKTKEEIIKKIIEL